MISQKRRAVLVPVKDLGNAKTRLAVLLTQEERRELAFVMLEGVLAQIVSAGADWERVMVTNYPPAIALAETHGFRVLQETEQVSESRSVDWASGVLAGEGVLGVLRIPLDLPVLRAEAVASLMRVCEGGSAPVLVPSGDGTGTNGIYRAPPTLFPSRFGPGSLALHTAAARVAGAEPVVFQSLEFGLDIDDSRDISQLVSSGLACPAVDYLRRIGIESRLKTSQESPG